MAKIQVKNAKVPFGLLRAAALLTGLVSIGLFMAGSDTVLQQVAYGLLRAAALFTLVIALKD